MTEIIDFEKLGRECEVVLKISEIVDDAKEKIIKAVELQPETRLVLDKVVLVSNLTRALKSFYKLNDQEVVVLIDRLKRENFLKVVTYSGSICYKLI